MAIQHTNRRGRTYTLHRGTTKSGKPNYFFSLQEGGELAEAIPSGFEIYEHVNGQVLLRRMKPQWITEEERTAVHQAIQSRADLDFYLVEVQERRIVIYLPGQDVGALQGLFEHFGASPDRGYMEKLLNYSPLMRFELVDDDKRLFCAERFCFHGSIDDWITIHGPAPLSALAIKYVPHLNKESFFELY